MIVYGDINDLHTTIHAPTASHTEPYRVTILYHTCHIIPYSRLQCHNLLVRQHDIPKYRTASTTERLAAPHVVAVGGWMTQSSRTVLGTTMGTYCGRRRHTSVVQVVVHLHVYENGDQAVYESHLVTCTASRSSSASTLSVISRTRLSAGVQTLSWLAVVVVTVVSVAALPVLVLVPSVLALVSGILVVLAVVIDIVVLVVLVLVEDIAR
ncbi:hypothetical protein CPB85DRAFT_1288488 [Mucidula mucida]|nr:hypothetical protein CPB85DRAFT_1288488 [Mucidula mucida]